jgi:hypothetical protein
MAALANALDAKGVSFDTDVARLAKRKWVKISHTSFTYDSSVITDVPFDTIEYNNGTPTDLTLDPYRIQLVAGIYAIQAKVIVPTSVAGTRWRVNVKDTTLTFFSTRADTNSIDFGSTVTPSTATLMDVIYVPTGVAKASITIPGLDDVSINYASLAAWWVSDA